MKIFISARLNRSMQQIIRKLPDIYNICLSVNSPFLHCLSFQSTRVNSPFLHVLYGVRVVHVMKLHVFMFLIPHGDHVRYDFGVKIMFGSSLTPFVCSIDVHCIAICILVSNTISMSCYVCVT